MEIFDFSKEAEDSTEFFVQCLQERWQITLRVKESNSFCRALHNVIQNRTELKILLPSSNSNKWILFISFAAKNSSKFQAAHPSEHEYVGHLLLGDPASGALEASLGSDARVIYLTGTDATGLRYPNNLSVIVERITTT